MRERESLRRRFVRFGFETAFGQAVSPIFAKKIFRWQGASPLDTTSAAMALAMRMMSIARVCSRTRRTYELSLFYRIKMIVHESIGKRRCALT